MSTISETGRVRNLCEVRFAFAGFLLLVVVTGCHVLGASVSQGTAMAGLCSLLFCPSLPLRYALGVGATAWALVTGFVVNELGELTFHPDDLLRLALQMAIATSGVAAGGVAALLGESRGLDASQRNPSGNGPRPSESHQDRGSRSGGCLA